MSTGVPLLPPTPQLTLCSDASTEGWGAHLNQLQIGGTWTPAQQNLHINNLEMLAVILALKHFKELVQSKTVLLMSDNTTVVAQIKNQGGTHSRELFSLTQQLFLWAHQHQVTVVPRHIPGHLNVIADRLSRQHQVIHTEWSLSPLVAQRIWKVWGQPHVDMFATHENTKLPTYVSPLPDNQAWKIDALSFLWEGLWMYLFPPIPLLLEVLHRIAQCQCEAVLVAPAWPAQTWFSLLLQLSVDHPRLLPATRTLLRQPNSQIFHQNPSLLALHAWRLSGPLSKRKATRRLWLGASPLHTVTAPRPSMTVDGAFTMTGALNEGRTHSLLLPL